LTFLQTQGLCLYSENIIISHFSPHIAKKWLTRREFFRIMDTYFKCSRSMLMVKKPSKFICLIVALVLAFAVLGACNPGEDVVLAKYRTASVMQLQQYAEARGEGNFTPENWLILQEHVDAGILAVNAAESVEQVASARDAAIGAVGAVPSYIRVRSHVFIIGLIPTQPPTALNNLYEFNQHFVRYNINIDRNTSVVNQELPVVNLREYLESNFDYPFFINNYMVVFIPNYNLAWGKASRISGDGVIYYYAGHTQTGMGRLLFLVEIPRSFAEREFSIQAELYGGISL